MMWIRCSWNFVLSVSLPRASAIPCWQPLSFSFLISKGNWLWLGKRQRAEQRLNQLDTQCLLLESVRSFLGPFTQGQPRLGAAVIIQFGTALRPSELLSLHTQHVYVPKYNVGNITIRLGVQVSTKIKREQCVVIRFDEHPVTYQLLARLHHATPPGAKLFPYTYTAYNDSFKLAEQHYHLEVGLTAHSGRAGFATSQIAAGIDPKRVQTAGRWASESSFKCYIDVASSLHTATQVKLAGFQQAAKWCEDHWSDFFHFSSAVNGGQEEARQCGTT